MAKLTIELDGVKIDITEDDQYFEETDMGTRGFALFINPEQRRCYVDARYVGSIPAPVYHRREVSIPVPANIRAQDLRDYLALSQDLLQAICDAYLGTEWDGNNHVGRWEESEYRERAEFELGEGIDQNCHSGWTDAVQWLSGSEDEILGEMLPLVRKGLDEMAIVKALSTWWDMDHTAWLTWAAAYDWVAEVLPQLKTWVATHRDGGQQIHWDAAEDEGYTLYSWVVGVPELAELPEDAVAL